MNILYFLLFVGTAWFAWGAYAAVATPQPEYEVIEELGRVEVRKYPSMHLATARGGNAFSILFNYISGSNSEQKKIPMTAPVLQSGDDMSFIVDSAPEPKDSKVRIEQAEPRTLAVIRFSGYATKQSYERHLMLLLDELNQKGIPTMGRPVLLQYSDPWTMPLMRRNEIAIEILNQ